MEPNRPLVCPTPAERKMMRDRWGKTPSRNLPPPAELERAQTRLTAAAHKGKAEFNRVWEEIFHGKYQSPGARAYVKPGLRKIPSS
jgi:hypothetical protein